MIDTQCGSRLPQWTVTCAVAAALAAAPALAGKGPGAPGQAFERIASFVVCANSSCDRSVVEATSAEIVAAAQDGRTLIYTDGLLGAVGFIGIADPAAPQPLGTVTIPDGEPTSVAVAGRYALVGVDTSASFTDPSGYLAIYDIDACLADLAACAPVRTLDLGGQPDSIDVSPDGRYGAIAIENERDEDVTVDGVEGGLPQDPPGFLQIVDLVGGPLDWTLRPVDLTGLAAYAPDDPEPEFVKISLANIAAVTLQENNHIVLVHLPSGQVVRHFPAGATDLEHVDTVEEDVIRLTGSLPAVAREPDAVAWLNPGLLVTANEGDLFGGSRGYTVFGFGGREFLDAGSAFEHVAVRHGHYPENRSENKGSEPEGVAVGRYGGVNHVFVGSERGNFVAVYRAFGPKLMEFAQLLPTGIGPEGILPLPERNLLVVTSEEDDPELAVRATVGIYALRRGPAPYPTIVSRDGRGDGAGKPIGWGALSALAADRRNPTVLYTVHDSYYKESRIYTVRVNKTPAEITDVLVLSKDGAPVDYDLEGLVQRAGGGFWAVSEGRGNAPSPGSLNLLLEIAADGTVLQEIKLPDAVNALQKSSGYEGVAVTGAGAGEKVYVAFQREWSGDPAGLVRIGEYTPASGEWRFFHYPLDPVESPAGGWVGLSEIVALGDERFAVVERDNQGGPDARIKRVYTFSTAGLAPAPQGSAFPVVSKTLAIDVLPALQAPNGWVLDKLEGLAIARDGEVYAVTDNDGVEDATGETQFLRLGRALK